ncbi:MAG: SRPBCC domain-containing protein [Cyanobacteria bacterium P01_G01_bin.67]
MHTKQKLSLMPGWTTEILINAPQAKVWQKVTDFANYKNWNPFVLDAKADFEEGRKINFLEDLQQFGQHWLSAKFLAIEAPCSFIWEGYLGVPFLFKVRHTFTLEALSNHQTRFRQQHENSGLLVPYLALRGIYVVSHQGYLNFDRALKQACE